MLHGPPWIQSTMGYFFDGSKFAGFISQPWIFRPSVEGYQISSASASETPSSTSAFTSTSVFTSAGRFSAKVTSTPGCLADERIGRHLPVAREGQAREHVGAARDLSRGTARRERQEILVRLAALLHRVVDPAAVDRPLDVARRAGQIAQPEPLVPAAGVHQIEVGQRARVVLVIVARVGDPLAVGRDDGIGVGAVAVGQGFHAERRQVDGVDLRIAAQVLGIGLADARNVDRPAVGRPLRSAVAVIARGDLARRAADERVDDKDMSVALGGRADAVRTPGQPVDDDGASGELRASSASAAASRAEWGCRRAGSS